MKKGQYKEEPATVDVLDLDENARESCGITRRCLLKSSAFVGGCAILASQAPLALSVLQSEAKARQLGPKGAYPLADPENILYTTCLQCHVDCQIKTKFWDGTLAKISGNPYSPQNFLPHIPYDTRPEKTATIDGKLCPKGQAGIQTYYDPYRIRKVLKRKGKRGANKWESIPFDRFIEEVTKGGRLFSHLGDERHYPGFDEVAAVRDPKLARQLAEDAKKFAKKEITLGAFRKKYPTHARILIDPEHPDIGLKNNGFVFMAGRIEHGRKELMKRFTHNAIGSVNAFEHTTICEQSHHIAYSMTTGHKTHHMKPDLVNSEFVLFWGTGAYSANFGMTPMAEKVTTGKQKRGMKTAVVDPRLSNDAAHADWWLPVKPDQNATLAMAFIRWIIENRRYDQRYLENANKAAANADNEPTWSNAPYLVKIIDGAPRELLRASEIGLGPEDAYVVSRNGEMVPVIPADKENAVEGDLFITSTAAGVPVKSAFQLLKEEAFAMTVKQYAKKCGIEERTIIEVAREFTSHGKKAVVELYRGPVQHPNGYYAGCAIILLNVLIGNADYEGGLILGGGHWHEAGGKPGSVYNFKKMHPGTLKGFGPPMTREKSRYEDYSIFAEKGYPAKRPWYPFTGNVYQEIIPSFAAGYPYPCKILFLHMGNPALSIPGANQNIIKTLSDPDKIPLFIASDIIIGESSMYADYILPDITFLERWGLPHVTPDVPTKTSKIRQPAAIPMTEEVDVAGERMPICLETFMIAVARKIKLPGFGPDAFGPGLDFNRPEDYYLKKVANIAYGDKKGKAVPNADARELAMFERARRHLPASVFDVAKWKKALRSDQEWQKVVYVLNRGGRFDGYGNAYGGRTMKYHSFGKMFNLFIEDVARQKNSMNGKYFSGMPILKDNYDCAEKPLRFSDHYPFYLITFKEPFGGHSRTISNYWSNISLQPQNRVWINTMDAKKLGLKQHQQVRVVSQDNPEGKLILNDGPKRVVDSIAEVEIMEGIRPGTLGVSWHYGHWAYGSNDVTVDGNRISGDPRRAAGICPNPVMRVDPVLKDICITDPIGGSASFNSTRVNLVAV
ncbi:MAG: molybdopterin-dependent oxidoreductase [Deltaproteobacteria bacterium]|nr:molybdopterin-dependent oxidoreductase [Deltaproteobacteria bacterium]